MMIFMEVKVTIGLDFGTSTSDELNNFFGEEGNDLLVGSRSTDSFKCGEGIDVVLNFNSTQGDEDESNCEMLNR
jgi:hypothetical protein